MTVKELAFMLTQVPQDAEVFVVSQDNLVDYEPFKLPKMFYYSKDLEILYLGGS